MVSVLGRGKATRKRDDEGRMSLGDHLRELRSRLGKSLLAVVVAGAVGLIFYQTIFGWLTRPFRRAVQPLAEEQGLDARITFDGIADPFTIPFKVALFTGIVLAAPVWIYQLWQFVTPGLYRHERRWAGVVVATSAPLFMSGVVLGYLLLPVGLEVILGFTPGEVSNYVSFSRYLDFVLRLLLVFGISFLLPVFVVLLNAVGVLSGQRLGGSSRWIVLGIFLFAAVATPTGDPITLLFLAGPMCVLFALAYLICRFNDRRRARALAAEGFDVGDDEMSPLGPAGEPTAGQPADGRPSRLDDDVT